MLPKNKQEKKVSGASDKIKIVNEISTAFIFDFVVGGWQKNSKTLSEKEYISGGFFDNYRRWSFGNLILS